MHARHPYPHHFTASGIVLHDDHVLLVFHKRLGAWVPPGGHIEPHEVPEETAVREILEETGVLVRIVGESVATGNTAGQTNCVDADAFFLTQPAYIQCVTAHERAGAFYHIDLAFACLPVHTGAGLPTVISNNEVEDVRWVPVNILDKLTLAKNVAEGVSHARAVLARLVPSTTIPTKI